MRCPSESHDLFQEAFPLAARAADAQYAKILPSQRGIAPDREDLKQEAVIRVWQALTKFDPSRASLPTFVEMVVRTRLATMLRASRFRPRQEALNERFAAEEREPRQLDLRIDIARVVAGVSQFDRAVALSLADASAVETSRCLGVSRAATYRAIGRLRSAFSSAGLAYQDHRSLAHRRHSCAQAELGGKRIDQTAADSRRNSLTPHVRVTD